MKRTKGLWGVTERGYSAVMKGYGRRMEGSVGYWSVLESVRGSTGGAVEVGREYWGQLRVVECTPEDANEC